jgi:PAS domain S-box-containing protein
MAAMSEPVDILLVDDRPADLRVLEELLADPLHRLVTAQTGKDALKRVLHHDFAVILLDMLMPDMDGFEVASIIKQRERSRHTPIVFLTAAGTDLSFIYRAYSVGAVDYLPKPIDPDVLRAKVRIFVELFRKDRRLQQQAEELREADRRTQELAITRLKLADQKRYRNLAEAIPQIVWTAGADGALDYVNANWVELTGMAREASRGAGWLAAVHSEDASACHAAWQEAVSTGKIFQAECRLRGRDGSFRWHLGRAVPELDDEGQVIGWLGTYTDFDDLKRAQAESDAASGRSLLLAEAGARLSSSLDAGETLREVVRLLVPELSDWCIVSLVDSEELLAGVGAWAHACVEQDDHLAALSGRFPLGADVHPIAARVLSTGKAELLTDLDPTRIAGDGELRHGLEEVGFGSALLAPLRARGRIFGILMLASGRGRQHDLQDLAVTDELARRIAMALDNSVLYRQAQQAIEARDEFLSIASHELRTPLTALQIQLQRLDRGLRQGQGPRAQQVTDRAEAALRQTLRLGRLVEELLDVSRIATGHLELFLDEFDLVDAVREVVERHREQAERAGCPVEIVATMPAQGRWDRLRIEQVVTNLFTNAIKYAAGNPIELSVRPDEETVQLVVRDHGMGISEEDLPRIFERFERAVSSQHFGGLGMGLYITRQIVEAHDGRIRSESRPNEGATFIVDLPRQPAATGAS